MPTSVAAAFSRAAARYDGEAALQARVAQALAAAVAPRLPPAALVLDVGAGTGFASAALQRLRPDVRLIVSDLSTAMVARARAATHAPALTFDAARPAIRPASVDAVISSLALQWLDDLPSGLRALSACLAPGGVLAVATLGARSLEQWRALVADTSGLGRTGRYPRLTDFEASFPGGAGRASELVLRTHHPDARAFLRHLRALGASANPGRPPMGIPSMRRALAEAPRPFEVTWHVLLGLWPRR